MNENARTDPRDVRESFPRLHQILLTRFCRENIHPLVALGLSSGFGTPRANEATRRISRHGRGYIRSHAERREDGEVRARPLPAPRPPSRYPAPNNHPPNSLSPGLLLRGHRATLPLLPLPSPRVCRYTRSSPAATPREGETGFTIVRAAPGATADTDGGGCRPSSARGVRGGRGGRGPPTEGRPRRRAWSWRSHAAGPTAEPRGSPASPASSRSPRRRPREGGGAARPAPAAPDQIPDVDEMYNYVRGRQTRLPDVVARRRRPARAAAERDASDPATPDRAGDSAIGQTTTTTRGVARIPRWFAAAASPPPPPPLPFPRPVWVPRVRPATLRDAVERVARELGIDPSDGGGADDAERSLRSSSIARRDDVDEAGAPTPEAEPPPSSPRR